MPLTKSAEPFESPETQEPLCGPPDGTSKLPAIPPLRHKDLPRADVLKRAFEIAQEHGFALEGCEIAPFHEESGTYAVLLARDHGLGRLWIFEGANETLRCSLQWWELVRPVVLSVFKNT